MNTTDIIYTDGTRGTATLETGKHGGYVLVLRKGYPVAAEVVGGIKAEQVSTALLDSLGVAPESIATVLGVVSA